MTTQLMYTSDIIGKAILAMDSGKDIGKVHDILYNISKKKIIAVVLDKGGWFSDAKVVMTPNIDSVGQDCVMVKSADSIVVLESDFLKQKPSSLVISGDEVKKLNIISHSGTRHGKIDDLAVDSSDLKIVAVKSSDGFFDNITSEEKWFPITAIESIGDDAAIVSDAVTPLIEARDNQKLEEWQAQVQAKIDALKA